MPNKLGQFVKGEGGAKPNAGRKKGVPNKLNTDTKKLILQALHESDPDGAIGYLKKIAKENSTAFVSLVRACMPREIVGKVDNNINVKQLSVHRLDISGVQEDELDVLEGVLRKTLMIENQKVIESSVIEEMDEEEALH